jgi:CRP-like cAMP-binding protein
MDEVVSFEVKRAIVKKQVCFSNLTDAELDELTNLFIEKPYSAGDTIVTEGDLVESVYLILSGKADVQHILIENGAPKITSVAQLGPEQAIGLNETGFYSLSGRRTATVVALTEMVLLRLSVAAFNGFALSHSHVNEVMHQFSKKIES